MATFAPQVDQILTASPGHWLDNPDSFLYQWNRSEVPIAGAVFATYIPTTDDIGNTISVSVVAVNAGGSSAPATSAATFAATDKAPFNITIPVISGTAQIGQSLSASPGTWTRHPTSFAYQWNRAGAAIPGATAATYALVMADIGNTLTVSVIASNTGGSSAPATSAPTLVGTTAGASLILDLSMSKGTLPLSA